MAAAPRQHLHLYAVSDVRAATKDFSQAALIGEGGFASVYSGELAVDGLPARVGVKRLRATEGLGAGELLSELQRAASVRHERLLPLFGLVRSGWRGYSPWPRLW